MPPLSLIRATWSAHYIIIGLVTRTIVGEEYRSLCTPLHSPVTLSR
jgi:hypothetical protein